MGIISKPNEESIGESEKYREGKLRKDHKKWDSNEKR